MLGGLVGRVFGRRASSAPEGVFPTVEWQVGGHCNYDCSYCIQSKASRVGQAEAATVEAVLSGLAALPGRWDIKMSGGEPFASKRFMTDIIPGLVARTPHRISVRSRRTARHQASSVCPIRGPVRLTQACLDPSSRTPA